MMRGCVCGAATVFCTYITFFTCALSTKTRIGSNELSVVPLRFCSELSVVLLVVQLKVVVVVMVVVVR